MMRWFKKKKIETDPLKRALDRKGVITRLEGMGYFVRKKNIRKPKVGDTVRFRVGGRWSINTHYFQTGKVVEWSDDDPHKPSRYLKLLETQALKDGVVLTEHQLKLAKLIHENKNSVIVKSRHTGLTTLQKYMNGESTDI